MGSARLGMAGLLGAPFVIVLVVIGLTPGPAFAGVMGDLRVYFDYSGRLLAGAIPYRDFAIEYPPLALLPMTLPRLMRLFGLPADGSFSVLFAIVEGALAVVVGWLIGRVAAAPRRAVAMWALLVLLAGASIAWRYDLWPATAVFVAFAATERGRPGLAGVALGAGTMLKLFPVVILLIFALRALALRDWPGLGRLVLGAGVVVGLVMGTSFALAGTASFGWLSYAIERGLQLESSGAGILLVLHVVAGLPFAVVHEFGTLQVEAPGAELVVAVTPYLELLLVGAVSAVALVRFRSDAARLGHVPPASLASAIVAVIVALIVSSKVFSAQYIVWFLPLIPFLPGRLPWLGLVITGLSTLIYPLAYEPLWHLDPLDGRGAERPQRTARRLPGMADRRPVDGPVGHPSARSHRLAEDRLRALLTHPARVVEVDLVVGAVRAQAGLRDGGVQPPEGRGLVGVRADVQDLGTRPFGPAVHAHPIRERGRAVAGDQRGDLVVGRGVGHREEDAPCPVARWIRGRGTVGDQFVGRQEVERLEHADPAGVDAARPEREMERIGDTVDRADGSAEAGAAGDFVPVDDDEALLGKIDEPDAVAPGGRQSPKVVAVVERRGRPGRSVKKGGHRWSPPTRDSAARNPARASADPPETLARDPIRGSTGADRAGPSSSVA